MNGLILIAFYLWRDIWRQWRTNPISLVSRLAVAGFLFALALALETYFVGVEHSVDRELQRVGLNRVILTHFNYGDKLVELDSSLGSRFDYLSEAGTYAYLRRVPLRAEIEMLGDAGIITYRDRDLLDLQQLFPAIDRSSAFILTSSEEIPEGASLSIWIKGLELKARIIHCSPALLDNFGRDNAILIPSLWATELEKGGYVEIIIFESSSHLPEVIFGQIERMQQLLKLDLIRGTNLQSGVEVLMRLDDLRQRQAVWSTLIRSVVTALIVLVFASTAFLEYRENAYLSALLQSLGVPRFLLFCRYLVEHILLLFFGFLGAAGLIALALKYPWTIPEVGSLDLEGLFSISSALEAWWLVLLGASLLSLIPVLLGLRREIGRVLQ